MAIVKDYKSWGEYRAALAQLDPGAGIGGMGAEWTGGIRDVAHGLEVADRGWPEGMEYVNRISVPIVQGLSEALESQEIGNDVTGAVFDVGEYLSGTPECWINPLHTEVKPCVSIAANIVSSAGIPAEALKRRGSAIVALTLALQQSGYAVRVYAVEGMNPGFRRDVWHRVCLTDDEGGPLDTDRLLFALAHPGAARCLGYVLGNKLAGVDQSNDGIGWASDDKAGKGCAGPEGWRADFELDAPYYTDANWESDEAVEHWVRHAYKTITGRPEDA